MQVGMKRTSINGPKANANANNEASKPWAPASSSPAAAAGPQLHSISRHGGNRAPLGEEREQDVWRSG